jgi:hypothetical protein
VPPWRPIGDEAILSWDSTGVSTSITEAGANVYICVRFFKVESVRVAEGRMRLAAWLRLEWVDPRLSWSPHDYGNVTKLVMAAAADNDQENGLIWVPDIRSVNLHEPLSSSFENSAAIVHADERVIWQRIGMLDVLCRFSGLQSFPFDSLKCPVEFTSWAHANYGHSMIHVKLKYLTLEYVNTLVPSDPAKGNLTDDPCYIYSPQFQPSSQATYEEFHMRGIACSDDKTPVITYVVTVERARNYYVLFVLVPAMLFSYLSFAVFFVSFQIGERLGYGITLVLTSTQVATARASLATSTLC